jgi:hypothetical protein
LIIGSDPPSDRTLPIWSAAEVGERFKLTKRSLVKLIRTTTVALVLAAAVATLAARAIAGDNWLIGTWSTSTGLSYTFTDADVTLAQGGATLGTYGNAKYDVEGDTIVVSADGLPGKATFKKADGTHATVDTGSGDPVAITKH